MHPVKIVAEVSASHLGSLDRAVAIVRAAAAAGAWGVKFQTFTPEQMVDEAKVIESGPWAGRRAIELYREVHTPREWHRPLFDLTRSYGLVPFSSVFHPDDVAFLETLDCPMYKIASFELTDRALIEAAARTGKPLVMSTGMASLEEIYTAKLAAAIHLPGCYPEDLTLLKCTSAYPADATEVNLATMVNMKSIAHVGLSDHTLGIGVAVAAVALGATMIEKHLTLNRDDGGPDAAFSMEPNEFRQLVQECHRAHAAIGKIHYGPTAGEAHSMSLRRASGGKRGG